MNVRKLITLLVLSAIVVLGFFVYLSGEYYLLFVLTALFICLPFIYRFENKKTTIEEIVLISVVTTMAVVGRLIFASLPGTPVMAIIIYAAVFFGKETGFIIGALTALLSNFFLGHGPWTAFQIAAWGLIGFFSGFFRFSRNRSKANIIIFVLWGAFTAVLFSAIMDINSVFFYYRKFSFSRYFAVIAVAWPVTLQYVIANVVFLAVFYLPAVNIFGRLRQKYGIGINK